MNMDNAIASLPPLSSQHSLTFNKSSQEGGKQKVRKKAANSWGQFLKQRRKELTENEPNAKVKRAELVQEWRCMGPAEKQIFEESHRKEKEKLGLVSAKVKNTKVKEKVSKVKNSEDS